MKIVHKTIILALAAICLLAVLAVPALSNSWDRGAVGIHHGGWLLLADDVTKEDLNNMTLAEIKDLKQQKMQELQPELKKIGLPEDLVQILPPPASKEMTVALMQQADLVVATGSQDNVRRAYSSGTPAIGVGSPLIPSRSPPRPRQSSPPLRLRAVRSCWQRGSHK